MNRSIHFFLFLSTILFSCSDKYQPYKSNYAFKSRGGGPDYGDLNYWAAHPWKWDPSDSIPKQLRYEPRDTSVDVFFIHPTTYTKKIKGNNAVIDDDYLNAKSDYSSILYQASVFNQQCRIFSPRYRQASIKVFFDKDEKARAAAFKIAYTDIVAAFEYYLQYLNNGRPIIIAGHSQGSLLAEKLLKDYFENKPLQKQLVVAYIPGWSVPKEYYSSLQMCNDSLETGCLCSWRTFRNNYVPRFLKFEQGNSYVTNPLTWTINDEYAPRSLNKGSVLFRFNKIYTSTTDARISNGFLYVKRPKFPWSFLYLKKNYHVGDINLYYMNIRENVRQRIAAFKKK
ncbi:MAG TPA: DUF3089 domain-containing protein, partial [Chitinophagaceae bacterium]|nr:DUF3089 domain-containing protein [Chitinophagaceae bacterium]